MVQAELQFLQSDKITFKKDRSVVSTDLSFLFANKTAETLAMSGNPKIGNPQENISDNRQTLDNSGTAISAVRQENNKTSVKRETLDLFGQNSP